MGILPKPAQTGHVSLARRSRAWKGAQDTLREHGYRTHEVTLNAGLCGVPQRRRRLFGIAWRGEAGRGDELENFYADNMADEELSVSEYLSGELGIEHYYRHPRSYARRGVFSASEPSPTIRGVNRPVPPRYPGHRLDTAPASEVRSLTTRERGRIQTFPKSWVWDHRLPKTVTEQLVGNAVPVKLARFVAEGIRAALF